MVYNQQIWPYQLATHNSTPILTHAGLAHLQFSFTINALYIFFMISHYSTSHDADSTSTWITVSHHPNDVIAISSGSPLDADLSDQFIHPTPEQTLQLTNQHHHKCAKHLRSMLAIH